MFNLINSMWLWMAQFNSVCYRMQDQKTKGAEDQHRKHGGYQKLVCSIGTQNMVETGHVWSTKGLLARYSCDPVTWYSSVVVYRFKLVGSWCQLTKYKNGWIRRMGWIALAQSVILGCRTKAYIYTYHDSQLYRTGRMTRTNVPLARQRNLCLWTRMYRSTDRGPS